MSQITESPPSPPTWPAGPAADGGMQGRTHVRSEPSPGRSPEPRRRGRPLAAAFVAGAALSAASFGLGTVADFSDDASSEPATQPATDRTTGRTSAVAVVDVSTVAALLGPSVVQVETDAGLGSGVVYDEGYVMTNHHVIANGSSFSVRTSDGRAIEARLVGSDPRNDIAVLEIPTGSDLPVADLALDDGPVVGETAVAIGSPFQLQQTVTAGIVSALNRPVPNQTGGFSPMTQTDAPINPGNSGGALADASARVIGINTSIRTDGTGNSNIGIGFAVPIDVAVDVATRIRSGASLEPGVLGVQAAAVPDGQVGVELGEVTPGSAAAAADLRAGDRVLTIDDAPVTQFIELAGLVQSKFAGDEIDLLVERSGERLTLRATLG